MSTVRIPRASFAITILDDEDYRLLLSDDRGLESFGAFVAITLVARHRLLNGRAHRIDGTDALVIDNSIDHVIDMGRVRRDQFDLLISRAQTIAAQTGSQPWLYVDDTGRLVIRSFFKFNGDAAHGGKRDNSGRKPSRNQGKSRRNQDGIKTNQDAQLENPSTSTSTSISSSDSSCVCVSEPAGNGCMEEDGPLGPNSAKEVRETLYSVEQLYPLTNVRIMARQWLLTHTAARVIAAVAQAHQQGAKHPVQYAQSCLEDPTFPKAARPARASPAKPSGGGIDYAAGEALVKRLQEQDAERARSMVR